MRFCSQCWGGGGSVEGAGGSVNLHPAKYSVKLTELAYGWTGIPTTGVVLLGPSSGPSYLVGVGDTDLEYTWAWPLAARDFPADFLAILMPLSIYPSHRWRTCKNAREFSSADVRSAKESGATRRICRKRNRHPRDYHRSTRILRSVSRRVNDVRDEATYRPFLFPTRWRSATGYDFSVCRRRLGEPRLLTRPRWDSRPCNRVERCSGAVEPRENPQTIENYRAPLALSMLSLHTKNTAASRAASIDNFPRDDVGKQGRPDRCLVSLLLTSCAFPSSRNGMKFRRN